MLFSDSKLIENWFFFITHSNLKLECSTKWWTSATPYSGYNHSSYRGRVCLCDDPIVPTMDCVNGRKCKDHKECGPKGECPTNFTGISGKK